MYIRMYTELYVRTCVCSIREHACTARSMPTSRFLSLITAAALDLLLTLFLLGLQLLASHQRKGGGLEH